MLTSPPTAMPARVVFSTPAAASPGSTVPPSTVKHEDLAWYRARGRHDLEPLMPLSDARPKAPCGPRKACPRPRAQAAPGASRAAVTITDARRWRAMRTPCLSPTTIVVGAVSVNVPHGGHRRRSSPLAFRWAIPPSAPGWCCPMPPRGEQRSRCPTRRACSLGVVGRGRAQAR